MNYARTKFEVATSNSLGEDAFTRKYTHWPWGQGHTKHHQYPLYYLIYMYVPAKFEVALTSGLGKDTITRNVTDVWTYDGPTLVRN